MIRALALILGLLPSASAIAQQVPDPVSKGSNNILPETGGGPVPVVGPTAPRYFYMSEPSPANPDGAPAARFHLHFPLNYHSAYIEKYTSGSTVSSVSDGDFNALRVNHANNMRRASVDQWWHSNGGAVNATTYIGNDGTGGARGSSNGIIARAYLYDQADFAAGKTGVEAQGLSGYTHALKARNNGHAQLWGVDSNVIGPTTAQEGGIFGLPVNIAKRHPDRTISISVDGNSDKRGAYGMTVQSIPGITTQAPAGADDDSGTATYPLDAAIAITGYTGDYDGANQANDGFGATARHLADYAIKIGGLSMGPWYEYRAGRVRSNSKINNGIDLSQHTGAAINIHDRHPLNTGTAITVTATGGAVNIGSNVSFSGLNAAGTIAGSWCSTAAGLFVYKVGANCF